MLKLCRVHERVAEAARRYGPTHQCMLNAVPHRGNALMELEEYAESEAMIRESLVLQREVLRPEPESTKLAARTYINFNIRWGCYHPNHTGYTGVRHCFLFWVPF